jgi:hypothetical protein
MSGESVQGSSPDMNKNIFEEDDYSDDYRGDDVKDGSNCSELVDDERYSSEFVDEIGNKDDGNSLSSKTDESEDDVGSDDSDVKFDNPREYYSEIDEEDSDDESSSDSGLSGIILIHHGQAIGNAAHDHDVILMERVSPEPGM